MAEVTLFDLDKKLDLLIAEIERLKVDRGRDTIAFYAHVNEGKQLMLGGGPGGTGLLIKVDRLYEDMKDRSDARGRQRTWLFGVIGGLIITMATSLWSLLRQLLQAP